LHQVGDLFELNVNLRCHKFKGKTYAEVFHMKVLSNVFVIKREKVISGRRKLYNEELHYFSCALIITPITK
jgi:hypothetical protein